VDTTTLARVESTKQDLSICCFLWNRIKFLDGLGIVYVNKLYKAVKKNCSFPFRFFCFYEFEGRSVNTSPLIDKEIIILPLRNQWRRNLRKLEVFRCKNELSGSVVMLDLDIVIIGSLDNIISYRGDFACVGPRMGGAVVSFPAGKYHEKLYEPMIGNYLAIQQRTRGSERTYYVEKLKYNCDFWQDILPYQVVSYKNDYKRGNQGVLDKARIVGFHGNPKPHKVHHRWVDDHWGKL